MSRVLLLAYQDRLDICFQNTVIKRSDRYPRISEDILHFFFDKTFDNGICSCHESLLS